MIKTINGGKQPTRGTKYSACVDLYSNEDAVVPAGVTAMIPLGVCIDLNTPQLEEMKTLGTYNDFLQSHYIQLEPRSSLRAKGLIASTGVIDMDFTKEWQLILHNPVKLTDETVPEDDPNYIPTKAIEQGSYRIIKRGDCIAQATILEHKSSLLNIKSTEIRTGGIGSTDLGVEQVVTEGGKV